MAIFDTSYVTHVHIHTYHYRNCQIITHEYIQFFGKLLANSFFIRIPSQKRKKNISILMYLLNLVFV